MRANVRRKERGRKKKLIFIENGNINEYFFINNFILQVK